ncbi:cupin domain-containing protein [Ruegeria sp. SCPT10]|uniref:cupin domain-containing protein n=1 Tax=Ruegeria sp. SCP10 TaxID=3141377 RepID=UPI0033356C97
MFKKHSFSTAILIATITIASVAYAKDNVELETIDGLTGPAKPVGLSIKTLNSISLSNEFAGLPDSADLKFRMRYVTLKPGGVVLIHSHKSRPAITYILSGYATEYRSDEEHPIIREAGDATMDVGGISQWWANKSDEEVVMLVADVINNNQPSDH